MNARGIYKENQQVLMVQQYTKSRKLIWHFPGGTIDLDETPEQACVREWYEETGYTVEIVRFIGKFDRTYWYEVKIVGGSLHVDTSRPENADLVTARYVDIDDDSYFDEFTEPFRAMFRSS